MQLPRKVVEDYSGCDGDVQRISPQAHGDCQFLIAEVDPGLVQAGIFVPQQDPEA